MRTSVLEKIGSPENEQLEYKAVLPPARSLAQMIAGFANASGGFIVLGVNNSNGDIAITGLSEDFQASGITHKAIDLLAPKPHVAFEYVNFEGKRLYVLEVTKSQSPVTLENKIYRRTGLQNLLYNSDIQINTVSANPLIKTFAETLNFGQIECTGAKSKFIDHYRSVLNMVEDLGRILYPVSINETTDSQEGKVLMRILLSSCADNFEIYLTDLLYEIYLANPASLKSGQTVTIKEVLDCADMQEFVLYWTKKKLGKLQRGSVAGFTNDNPQIKDLNILDEEALNAIENILQIRHLYAHRNGIVDEKFSQNHSGDFEVNQEHQLSVREMLGYLSYLFNIVDKIDKAAILKYRLATL